MTVSSFTSTGAERHSRGTTSGEHETSASADAERQPLESAASKYVLTTDSQHDLPVYPNLIGRLALTGFNQLWIADITYIRLRKRLCFSPVVLDAYSRRQNRICRIGNEGTQDGLNDRTWQPGVLIHHSDRGV